METKLNKLSERAVMRAEIKNVMVLNGAVFGMRRVG